MSQELAVTVSKTFGSRLLRVIVACLRIALGGVFIAAAVPKIANPAEFASSLNAYQILPVWALGLTAWLLPWIECALGVLLVLGYWKRLSFAGAGILLLVFLIAVISAMVRGLNIDCGCFGTHEPVGWTVLLRDVGMLGMLGMCAIQHRVSTGLCK